MVVRIANMARSAVPTAVIQPGTSVAQIEPAASLLTLLASGWRSTWQQLTGTMAGSVLLRGGGYGEAQSAGDRYELLLDGPVGGAVASCLTGISIDLPFRFRPLPSWTTGHTMRPGVLSLRGASTTAMAVARSTRA